MPSPLKRQSKLKLFRIDKNQWEFWLFVVSLVTILGFIAQTHRQADTDLTYFRSQAKAEVYDIRVPNNNRVVHDRLETGR
jgi:hypothetical protein